MLGVCLKCRQVVEVVKDELQPSNVLACGRWECMNHMFDKGFIIPKSELLKVVLET